MAELTSPKISWILRPIHWDSWERRSIRSNRNWEQRETSGPSRALRTGNRKIEHSQNSTRFKNRLRHSEVEKRDKNKKNKHYSAGEEEASTSKLGRNRKSSLTEIWTVAQLDSKSTGNSLSVVAKERKAVSQSRSQISTQSIILANLYNFSQWSTNEVDFHWVEYPRSSSQSEDGGRVAASKPPRCTPWVRTSGVLSLLLTRLACGLEVLFWDQRGHSAFVALKACIQTSTRLKLFTLHSKQSGRF